jgi:hypothetical protein
MNEPITQYQIDSRARYFYLACLVIFILRFASSALFSQLSQPVLIGPGIDNTYWLFHWLHIPYIVTHSVVWSAVLDMLMFVLPVIASLIPRRRLIAVLFTLLVFVYQVTYSTYAIHHYHSLVGVLFLSIPFWFGPGQRFILMWQAARYYFFFIFSSAALWKLSSGSLWAHGQMSSIMMAQHAQTIYEYPSSMLTHLRSYIIAHPTISTSFLWAGFLLQLSFLGGFFTKKYDRAYLVLFLAFFVVNYLLMGIFSVELFIFCLVLLDWDKIEAPKIVKGALRAN